MIRVLDGRRLRAAGCALLLLCATGAAGGRPAFAEDPASGEAGAQEATRLAWGSAYFNQAVAYVWMGTRGQPIDRFHIALDAHLDMDTAHHEGPMRLWYRAPDAFRQELELNRAVTTKILRDGRGWTVTSSGGVQELGMSAETLKSLAQLTKDRDRLVDITRFFGLESLRGGGATFRYEGVVETPPFARAEGRWPPGTLWVQVVRQAPGAADMTFWLRKPGPKPQVESPEIIKVEAPELVRVEGEGTGETAVPAEVFLLRDWQTPRAGERAFRYPRRVGAYTLEPGGTLAPFLTGVVDLLEMNQEIPDRIFQPRR